MIDHLTLNTILNVVWYATNISFQYGQQQFHSIFTLFAPLAIPIYRYCFQNTPPPCYNFSLRKWITYALAYCFLLLLTRDTVEFMTLGNPFLDDILTLVRITLAVFWFSIIRHAGALYLAGWNGAARGLVRDLVDLAVGSKLPLGKALIVTGVTVRVFFLLGHVSGSPPPHPALVGTALLALTVYGICLLAVALGPFCWRRYIEPAMVCASDWTRLLTVTPARSIYRRGQTLVGNIQTHRLLVPFAFSSLVTLGVMAGFVAVGVRHVLNATPLSTTHLNPHNAVSQLGSSADYPPTAVQLISQDLHTNARPWLMGVASNLAVVPFEQATKAYQLLAHPTSIVLMYLSSNENLIVLIWQALRTCFQHAIAAVCTPAEQKPVMEVEIYEYEEIMTEAIKIGQVCYNEDGIELPCWYGPEASEETSVLGLLSNCVRRVAAFLGMF